MKQIIFSLMIFYGFCAFSQTTIEGRVKDSKTGEPLSYCNISIKGTVKGAITNRDGEFSIMINRETDTLVFSYLGYVIQQVSAKDMKSPVEIKLKSKYVVLKEFTVSSDNNYLYEIVENCRKNLQKNTERSISKAYFGLESDINNQPAELLECYYNSYLKGTNIEDLLLKNGRVGLAIIGSRVFNNRETSLAITKLDLLNINEYFPTLPLQYNRKDMKKNFYLSQANSDSSVYLIKFNPTENKNKRFSGEIWIDKNSNNLLKISMKIENAQIFPFVSILEDSIHSVSLDITETFREDKGIIHPELILFDYFFTYITGSNKTVIISIDLPDKARVIKMHSVLSFYDYGNPFLLPWFSYNSQEGEYKKLAMIPYNKVFWDNNNALVLTKSQKDKLGLFSKDGYLINFAEGNYGKDFCKGLANKYWGFDMPYTFWAANKRILINRKLNQNEVFTPQRINQSIPRELYNIKVQLLLDIVQTPDSLHFTSFTVLDETQSFFHFPDQEYTSVFINIFYDICEIERRKLEVSIRASQYTIPQIEAIYNKAVSNMDKLTEKYLEEVQMGKNTEALTKWNDYVVQNLGINNIEMFKQ